MRRFKSCISPVAYLPQPLHSASLMEDPKVGEEKNAVVPIRRAPSFGVEARGEGEASPRREAKQPRDIFEVPLEDNFTKPLWIQLNSALCPSSRKNISIKWSTHHSPPQRMIC